MKKFIISLLLFISFVLSTVPLIKAATIYAQGGVWNYGIGSTYVWSYYSHNSKAHASTAVGKYTSYSGKTRPGIQARASAPIAFWGNQTYYKVY
ncbi:lactococcin 972 family bacteriocin [Staphylococcus caeli]|uniref:Bacteriocin, lactococcin 972 family protein n=1 Tax=Staphylococcus caeli TaxID=2201815 RepID=A0A1D4J9V0_9STAP|nr:lactococcin 972 family bacteriocin [Staphylococcus caeli]SCS40213.1 bacteriocin, lactococcin 972 family protein [Staphylococcus caeli]SCS58575.1 bacteriocin, lactococcin 972 family protein [Staphylococcus caeli]